MIVGLLWFNWFSNSQQWLQNPNRFHCLIISPPLTSRHSKYCGALDLCCTWFLVVHSSSTSHNYINASCTILLSWFCSDPSQLKMHYSFKSVFSSVSYLQQTTKAPLLFERFTLPVICSILQYNILQHSQFLMNQ